MNSTRELWHTILNPLGPVSAQGAAYAANLAGQLLILAVAGPAFYAPLGLALVTATTLCFAGDLGYGTLFLREGSGQGWLIAWQRALGQRLLALTLLLIPTLPLYALLEAPGHSGTWAFLGMAPGILLSAAIPTPLLFAQGHHRSASAGIVARWAVHTLLLLLALGLAPLAALPLVFGLIWSTGQLVQTLWGIPVHLPPAVLRPRLQRGALLPNALSLWGVSLLATVYDRLLLFAVQAMAPALLPPLLLFQQILQGFSGLAAQIGKILTPALARRPGNPSSAPWETPLPSLIHGTLGVSLLLALLPLGWAWSVDAGEAGLALLLVVEWFFATLGGILFATALGIGQEAPLLRLMTVLFPLSAAAQLLTLTGDAVTPLFLLRPLAPTLLAWYALRLIQAPLTVRSPASEPCPAPENAPCPPCQH